MLKDAVQFITGISPVSLTGVPSESPRKTGGRKTGTSPSFPYFSFRAAQPPGHFLGVNEWDVPEFLADVSGTAGCDPFVQALYRDRFGHRGNPGGVLAHRDGGERGEMEAAGPGGGKLSIVNGVARPKWAKMGTRPPFSFLLNPRSPAGDIGGRVEGPAFGDVGSPASNDVLHRRANFLESAFYHVYAAPGERSRPPHAAKDWLSPPVHQIRENLGGQYIAILQALFLPVYSAPSTGSTEIGTRDDHTISVCTILLLKS